MQFDRHRAPSGARSSALALGRQEGGQIRVTNEAGGIVVLVGVSTALSLQARRAA